jgi:hypothetical protein
MHIISYTNVTRALYNYSSFINLYILFVIQVGGFGCGLIHQLHSSMSGVFL